MSATFKREKVWGWNLPLCFFYYSHPGSQSDIALAFTKLSWGQDSWPLTLVNLYNFRKSIARKGKTLSTEVMRDNNTTTSNNSSKCVLDINDIPATELSTTYIVSPILTTTLSFLLCRCGKWSLGKESNPSKFMELVNCGANIRSVFSYSLIPTLCREEVGPDDL